jgi:hypothetical protein
LSPQVAYSQLPSLPLTCVMPVTAVAGRAEGRGAALPRAEGRAPPSDAVCGSAGGSAARGASLLHGPTRAQHTDSDEAHAAAASRRAARRERRNGQARGHHSRRRLMGAHQDADLEAQVLHDRLRAGEWPSAVTTDGHAAPAVAQPVLAQPRRLAGGRTLRRA